jgi:predicted DsbA family dithiol-disulfide isomerase
MSRIIKIDLYSDVVCPWCLIGSARLDKAIAALPASVAVDIENHPFYLDPSTPPEGYDVQQVLRRKYGGDPRPMQARVETEAAKAGLALDLGKQPRTFPTARAHTLVRLARPKGTQHALANAIASAYFFDHRPINEGSVLVDIATKFGFDEAEAVAAIADEEELAITEALAIEAMESGIRGVPFTVFDQRYALSGAQPQEVFDRAVALALQREHETVA